ncbi:MAG: hypothetical protein V7K26_01235 [Nostoc sp.]|uniref:hypothetical protein n=1 Tax=Nostoc sp. TaxID=1180 RepID=UPI002FF2047E
MNDFSILLAEALIFASSYLGDACGGQSQRIIELPNRYETVAPLVITTLCGSIAT